jgi:NitT/TauT family transport system ATP-binding protein
MTATLTAREISVTFGERHVLGPVSFHMDASSINALVGPSGCGKSTLIRTFAGLQAPTQGYAVVDGQTVSTPSPRVRLMFQTANLMPWRSVTDNIALPLEITGMRKEERLQKVQPLLHTLGLDGFGDAFPGQLSGGMAQRVALGRVLIQHPDVMLLDEPFGALDALTREQISMDLLAMLRADPKTVVMVTHDINEAVLVSDRVIVLSPRPGHIVADIAVDLPRPRHPEQLYQPEFAAIARQVRTAIGR